MKDNKLKPKFPCSLFANSLQLMFSHLTMRLVLYSLDFVPVLNWSNYTPKIKYRTCLRDMALGSRQGHLCNGNFTNDICHEIKLLGKVVLLY
ncbi:MAG TPA: hypothetical protein VFQ78_10135 [Candidatus Udaeobacter sp.]|nr:hypothetical protein [Candidatus Udaeobacter sp.]